MKPHSDTDDLIQLAAEMPMVLTAAQAELLLEHWRMVQRASETQNLTAIRDTETALRLHVMDSLAAIPLIEEMSQTENRLIDLGAGAGYPGIPIAVATGHPVILLEPRRKRAEFLRVVATELGLENVEVVHGRAEDAARTDLRDSATFVVARAVAALPALIELSAPLLCDQGVLLALKGKLDAGEAQAADAAGRIAGMRREQIRAVQIPRGDETRTIAAYRRVGRPEIELPRRPGLAQKRPLG